METSTQTQTKPKWERQDLYQQVTDTIIQQLENGVIPWHKPWKGGHYTPFKIPANAITNNKYNGINIVLLWSSSLKNNFRSDEWASFKQWRQKKESIRKGEKGSLVVYYDTFEKEVEGETKKIPFLKSSVVFNRCQLNSYVQPEELPAIEDASLFEQIYAVDQFLENTKAVITHHEFDPCYNNLDDTIYMPQQDQFASTATCTATEGYYSTLLHELIHWSGASARLNRLQNAKFGDQKYAAEELVAEFGAAFLCAGFGIATVNKGEHAGYIDSWLKVLKENNRSVFYAASEASKAVNYLNNLV